MNNNVLTLRNCTFAFKCTATWENMTDVGVNGAVRFCSDCQKEVYYCKTDKELVSHVKLNRCIAIHSCFKGNEAPDDDFITVGLPIDPSYF